MDFDPKAVKVFMRATFKHFNAATVVDAAEGWSTQLREGNRMFLTMAGRMSTAELGISLAEMIRQEKIHAICCTGANLEEDIFNLVAHNHYTRLPNYRELPAESEAELAQFGMNRVTDTCIPEEALRKIEGHITNLWHEADEGGIQLFPHEFVYQLLLSGVLEKDYQIDPQDSWLLAAAEKRLPLFIPGWEDSTLGNMFVAA